MKFLASLAVGVPLIFLGLIIFTGGVENAAMIVFCTVVLSYGVALFVWIPLCWGVGAATLALIGSVLKGPDGKERSNS